MTKTLKRDFDCGKCLELALEGERLCKSYEFDKGITQFKAALERGTNDKRVLSAIFSQLGNAYFYKKDYHKALRYHELDLKLSQTDSDLIGESKACGNLGNTYKMLEKFEEAIFFCTKHLGIARLLRDKVGESRALYNLGNVYHTKGKTMAINSNKNLIDFSPEIKECLLKAVEYYKLNLILMKEAGDRDAQGRACGNIGNTYYLLGEFEKAIDIHKERLQIARECEDKEAERRAHCNLGNAHIFCGEFEKSIENYKQSLFISQEIGNLVLEAQAYFSLGNAYFLLKDYKIAIDNYLKHLKLAQQLDDKLGQSRACWSLGNAYNELGDTEGALKFANYHLQLAKETNDKTSEEIANKSVVDLKKKLEETNRKNLADISNSTDHNLKVKDGINYFQSRQNISSSTTKLVDVVSENDFFNKNISKRKNILNYQSKPYCSKTDLILKDFNTNENLSLSKTRLKSRKVARNRKSMENMEIMKLTPTRKENETNILTDQIDSQIKQSKLISSYCSKDDSINESEDCENFLDLLANFQSKRMDDQRCSIDFFENKENCLNSTKLIKNNSSQNINRSISSTNNHLNKKINNSNKTKEMSRHNSNPSFAESTSTLGSKQENYRDELFDLIEGMQSNRMDEQRAQLPNSQKRTVKQDSSSSCASTDADKNTKVLHRMNTNVDLNTTNVKQNRQMSFSTDILPNDDFIDMLIKCQSSRLEDQRTTLPSFAEAANNNNNEDVLNQNLINEPNTRNNFTLNQLPNNNSRNEDDFLNLVMRFQADRIEEQRSNLPKEEEDLINLNSSGSNCDESSKKNNSNNDK